MIDIKLMIYQARKEIALNPVYVYEDGLTVVDAGILVA